MKKLSFLLLAFSLFTTVNAQVVNIPDANFKAKLLEANPSNTTAKNFSDVYFKIDANSDGQIQLSEALLVKQLNISNTGIYTLVGISSFTNIQTLYCTGNQLQSLDASGLTNLRTLFCGFNRLTTLNVGGLTNLQDLVCEGNQLSSLDLTGLINLIIIRSQENSLTSINLNGLANLEVIDVLANNLSVLDLTGLSKLKYLDCDFNQLTSLDLSGLNNLLSLIISYNNISNIDVSQLTKLEYLNCEGNQLTALDLRGLASLSSFNCLSNPNLSCISVDNVSQANQNNNWIKDEFTIYSLDCTANQVPFVGQTFTSNGINYIVTKATFPFEVAVGSNTTFVGVANIPVSVTNAGNSFAVTSIGDDAFFACTGLTSITIPNSVTRIGIDTFNSCTSLAAFTIPSSVTSIGAYAFNDCIGLTSLSIPNSVTSIANDTFGGCTGLTSISIPNSVTSISVGAFGRCTGLTSVTIGNAVTSIGQAAFGNCTSLTSITIPNSVTSIGVYAFVGCIGLTLVNIPNSVTSIGIFAFQDCIGLTAVTVNWTTPVTIFSDVFKGLTLSAITLNVPTGTEILYNSTFGWTSFPSITDEVNYCKGTTAQPLTALFTPESTLKWYTAATGGRASIIAPRPTTTIVGAKLYYVALVVNGIESTRETITVNTFALPATPGTITGTAAQGRLVGTTLAATYTIAVVVNATSYTWTAPLGVNIISGQGTNTVTVNFADVPAGAGAIGNLSVVAFNSNDCKSLVRNLALTKALPVAPSSIKMTNVALPLPLSGVRPAITTFAPYMGTTTELTLTARPSLTATSYVWELPTGVVVTNGSATTVGGVTESASNEITVNFSGVTNTNTFNYMTTAAVPVSTNNLRIGVYSKNGTGLSTTSNVALVNSSPLFTPNNTSTARLLTLTAVRPVAPTSLKMYNPLVSTTVAVTDISKFIGTTTELTLTATVSRLASSYTWEIPSEVTIVAGSDLTSNSIKVTFENVPAGTASLYLGVKAVNGIGSSVTNNSALTTPATTSEARLLKVTAMAPSIVGTVTGSLAICSLTASDVVYSIATAATRANTYNITVPMGCTIDGGTTNTATIVATAGAMFTVNYPAGFTANTTTAIKKIFIQSENGFGVSTTNKTLSLTNVGAVCTPKLSNTNSTLFEVIAYPNPSSSEFTIETSAKGAINVKVYDMQGRLVENTNSTQVGSRLATGTYNVIVNQGDNTKTVRVIKK